MMRKLAFMCMLYPEALFESITYGNIGCYRNSNYTRISEPPYENYMRQQYNDIIDNYNSCKNVVVVIEKCGTHFSFIYCYAI